MKQKYYAVRKGTFPGIYRTWEECSAAVAGFSGAEYKSFSRKIEAQDWLNSTAPVAVPTEDCPVDTVVAYVDGSFDASTGRYGYGCVILTPDGEVTRAKGWGDRPEARTARNVAGELLGAMYALRWAAAKGYRKLILCHDYNGIAFWYEGKWKASSDCAKKYLEFVRPYQTQMEVSFRKIAAHTGVKYNEEADALAKEALGLLPSQNSKPEK